MKLSLIYIFSLLFATISAYYDFRTGIGNFRRWDQFNETVTNYAITNYI